MSVYAVSIKETRELIFEVEADSKDEAGDIALDIDSTEAVRDSFDERTVHWVEEKQQ